MMRGKIVGMKLKVEGIPCRGCADDYEQVIREKEGIVEASINYNDSIISIRYDEEKISRKEVFITARKLVRKATIIPNS